MKIGALSFSGLFRVTCVALFVAGPFLLSLNAHGDPNIIRVGHGLDPACDYDDIYGALIAAANDGSSTTEIRLAIYGSYFAVAANISDQSVDLIGGFADCSDDDPGTAQTTLYADTGLALPVILVENGTSTRHQVLLKNLVLREATSVSDGGGAKLRGDVQVVFDNVDLTANSASRGGGVFIDGDGDDIDVRFTNLTEISFNTATEGGGVFCIDHATVLFESGAIAFNEAGTDGGGVYVAEHCHFTSQAGGLLQGIYYNQANSSGAGVFAGNAEPWIPGEDYDIRFDMKNNSSSPALLTANECLGDCRGGGVRGFGSSVRMEFVNAVINGNSARYGGGIHLDWGAELNMRAAGRCSAGSVCSGITNNAANPDGSLGWGGGIYITSGAQAWISRTEISGNSADQSSAIRVQGVMTGTGVPARLFGEGLLIVENSGADDVIFSNMSAESTLAYVTISDNRDQLRSIEIEDATLSLYSSIVWDDYGNRDTSVFLTTGSSNLTVDLLMAHEVDSVPFNSRAYFLQPGFVDPDGDDYRLGSSSLAIDRGDTAVYVPQDYDMEGQARGFEDGGTANIFGTFDLGADEYVYSDIFNDGFERGDTTDWSNTVH